MFLIWKNAKTEEAQTKAGHNSMQWQRFYVSFYAFRVTRSRGGYWAKHLSWELSKGFFRVCNTIWKSNPSTHKARGGYLYYIIYPSSFAYGLITAGFIVVY